MESTLVSFQRILFAQASAFRIITGLEMVTTSLCPRKVQLRQQQSKLELASWQRVRSWLCVLLSCSNSLSFYRVK